MVRASPRFGDWTLEEKTEVESAPTVSTGTAFKQMSGRQKMRFICKLVVCIVTFGMAFPHVMND